MNKNYDAFSMWNLFMYLETRTYSMWRLSSDFVGLVGIWALLSFCAFVLSCRPTSSEMARFCE